MDSRLHDQDILISKCSLKWSALERRIKHYSNLHQILLVGDGDFSFSLALANAFGSASNMVATSLDSRGFCGKEHDNKLIRKHRHLLQMFFKNGLTMLNKMGEIHVTHKEKDPYDKWKLVEQAENCGLILKESVNFDKADYPGYTNRRGAGPNIGETFFLGECRTYMFVLREFMTSPTMLPKISSQSHPKSLKAAILELETERQNRKAAETEKTNLEFSFNELRTVADKALKERDKFRRQKDEALRGKANITKQLAEALRLKEHATKQKDVTILELEFERKAREDAESDGSLYHYKALEYELELERDKMNQLGRQRDDALYQKEAACREKEKLARQLDEAMRLKEEATNEKERILREHNYLTNQEAKVNRQLLAEALRLKEDAVKKRDESFLELEFERKARKNAESANANIEASLNYYKVSVYDWELKEMNKLVKQRDDALYQKEAACREKEKLARQLDEAMRLKEEATNEKERILREHNYLTNQEAKVKRQLLAEVLRLKEDAVKMKDDALYHKEVAHRKKEKNSKQLNEPLLLKEEATIEKERILSEPNDLANQKEEITCWSIFAYCCFRR
ncbi:uncharacterized protein LOC131050913 isoform X2 [Cryptomeria japonica]|uniref:uncharacterized protein LOC131050913 isoform X2 n=1 Tax=Cryptomeria japonica TaxID=3369 RepID=UPI0027D9FDBB|nr:uncharacterized protein LOC131050913 isoform X2 [Cryptomeria japonica]